MPIGATIGAGVIGAAGSLGAGYMASQGGKKAGALYDPWMNTGNSALMTLSKLYGLNGQGGAFSPETLAAFRNTPGYQFTLGEGLRANDFGDSARGQLLSSNNQRGRADYASGLADKTFMGSYVNPLMSIAQGGLTAASGKAGALTGAANQMAGGVVGAANAGMGALGNYMNYQNNQNNTQAILGMMNRGAYGQPQSSFGGNQQWGNAWGNNGSFGAAG